MKKIFDQIDQQLLINHPHLWATKLHSFLFAYIFFLAAVVFVGFTFPINTENVPADIETHFICTATVAGIVYLIWLYQVSLFNVNRQFGNIKPFSSVKSHIVYLLIIILLSLSPFIYAQTLIFRVNKLVSPEELLSDCNKLNIGMYYVNYSTQNFILSPKTGGGYWGEEVIQHLAQDREGQIQQIKEFVETAQKYGGFYHLNCTDI